jgi:hypothetical protein
VKIYFPLKSILQVLLIGVVFSIPLNAQQQSADDLARELSNPTSALASMNANFEFRTFQGDLPGADEQSAWNFLFQPVIPFPQSNGYNILFRPAIPVFFNQPVFDPANSTFSPKAALGDIGFDLAYGTTSQAGLLYLFGMVGTLPTATDDALGPDQLRLGPEIAIGLVKKWGVIGGLLSHQWDVAGSNDVDTNLTSVQYFYAFGLGGGWQFAAGPSVSFDHEASSGNRWTVPIGLGIGKTTQAGSTPLKMSVQVWKYVAQPDSFGPDWQLRITISPVLKLPWG